MSKIITILLLFSPLLAACQGLPVEALKQHGLTKEEIQMTKKMKGENGRNGYFLLYRQKNTSTNPNSALICNHFELLTPEHKFLALNMDNAINQSEIIFFEFVDKEVVLIEKNMLMRPFLRVSRYDIITGEMNRVIVADIPCTYGQTCDWFRPKEKKAAFFTNTTPPKGLDANSIYEYNWQTDQTTRIYGQLPLAIDAVTGRNFELKDVRYNKTKQAFEYIH